MRIVSPPREELDHLRTPLTAGERRLFEIFDAQLDLRWEIYVQPHLNGLRPDLVLLNPAVGVAVFEIKDGSAPDYRAATVKSAVDQARRYADEMKELYIPTLGQTVEKDCRALAVLTTVLVFTKIKTVEARTLCADDRAKHLHVVGADLVEQGDIEAIFPDASRRDSWFMTPRMANELRSWLVEPSVSSDQRVPLTPQLSPKQREILRAPLGRVKERLIKGTAGSGKSLVLAARVARLVSEGKSGLVLTFNITLLHYLRDLAARELPLGSGKLLNQQVVWIHFHAWCKRAMLAAGRGEQYRALGWDDDNTQILETILPAAAANAMEKVGASFDFVFVDEGQDFHLDWWRSLRALRDSEGEMLLVADRGQDLYARSKNWTDEFRRGGWINLDTNFRTPPELVPILRDFLTRYVDAEVRNLPELSEGQQELFPTQLKWVQVESQAVVPTVVTSIEEAQGGAGSPSVADFTVLVQSNSRGLELCDAVKGKYELHHTFAPTPHEQRVLKNGFQRGDARMKATTIHSFRGFESRFMFVAIDCVRSAEDYLAVYAALSRLLRHPAGSSLTVICAEPALEQFGRTFPFQNSADCARRLLLDDVDVPGVEVNQ